MNLIELSNVQATVNENKILWTEHVAIRLREHGMKRADVLKCIECGEIIEQYLRTERT